LFPAVGEVVAVEMFERESDVAEGDFYGLGFEFGLIFKRVDELFLLFCQVGWEQDFRVES
jgi:hypothetical protein